MYAYTPNSYRSIASASDALPTESVADTIPQATLDAIIASQAHQQRDALLAACDWTQAPDSPLDAAAKSAWASYRTALRNVPQQTGFPVTIDWPMQP